MLLISNTSQLNLTDTFFLIPFQSKVLLDTYNKFIFCHFREWEGREEGFSNTYITYYLTRRDNILVTVSS